MSAEPITLPPLSSVEAPLADLTRDDAPSGTSLADLLDDAHAEYASARGVTEAAALAAGWRSVGDAAGLREVLESQGYPGDRPLRYGRAVTARLGGDGAGALVCPRWHPDGSPGVPQIRLDDPREGAGGRAVKWETPSTAASTAAGLTATASAPVWWAPQSWMSNPAVPVIVSEGETRVLATATAAAREGVAVVPVSVTGVWNAVVTSKSSSGTVISRSLLPDLAALAMHGRTVIVSYDHDAVVKRGVRDALEALAALLEAEGARVLVMVPPIVGDDPATGLDDALAAGHSLAEMVAEAVPMAGLPPLAEKAAEDEDEEPTDPYASVTVPDREHEPLAEVLEAVHDHLARYVAPADPADLDLAALWIAHTHLSPSQHYSPRLIIEAMMKGSGKTTMGEHLVALAPEGKLIAAGATAALMPRLREARPMYVMALDEVEKNLVQRRSGTDLGPLIAMLNSGYKRSGGALTLEQVSDGETTTWEPVERPTYGPVILIGTAPDLADDLVSRSLHIGMVRSTGAGVEATRWHLIADTVADLRERLIVGTVPHRETIGGLQPSWIPSQAWGRAEERWLSLAQIAEAADGRWPGTVEAMIRSDLEQVPEGDDDGPEVRLIRDAHRAMRGVEAMTSAELAGALEGVDRSRWGTGGSWGRAISPKKVGALLRRAGVRGHRTERGMTWTREALMPSWRALGLEAPEADESSPILTNPRFVRDSSAIRQDHLRRSGQETDESDEYDAHLSRETGDRDRGVSPSPSISDPYPPDPHQIRQIRQDRSLTCGNDPDESLTNRLTNPSGAAIRQDRGPDPDDDEDLQHLIGTVNPGAARASRIA